MPSAACTARTVTPRRRGTRPRRLLCGARRCGPQHGGPQDGKPQRGAGRAASTSARDRSASDLHFASYLVAAPPPATLAPWPHLFEVVARAARAARSRARSTSRRSLDAARRPRPGPRQAALRRLPGFVGADSDQHPGKPTQAPAERRDRRRASLQRAAAADGIRADAQGRGSPAAREGDGGVGSQARRRPDARSRFHKSSVASLSIRRFD